MKITNEISKCDNCQAECPIQERESVVFGTLLYFKQCGNCGYSYISEDKIHWDPWGKTNLELMKPRGQE